MLRPETEQQYSRAESRQEFKYKWYKFEKEFIEASVLIRDCVKCETNCCDRNKSQKPEHIHNKNESHSGIRAE